MGVTFEYPVGATPLDRDEAAALIPSHISTQGQLNAWELQNVLYGERWAFGRKHRIILSLEFMRLLHKRMFGDTWRWAGEIRTTEKNIGIAPGNIYVEIKILCDDVETQLKYNHWPMKEIAARFHHRLVSIHPFPNGNGRFSRTMADLLLGANGEERFAWGADLVGEGEIRSRYISSLRSADQRDYSSLFYFLGLANVRKKGK